MEKFEKNTWKCDKKLEGKDYYRNFRKTQTKYWKCNLNNVTYNWIQINSVRWQVNWNFEKREKNEIPTNVRICVKVTKFMGEKAVFKNSLFACTNKLNIILYQSALNANAHAFTRKTNKTE